MNILSTSIFCSVKYFFFMHEVLNVWPINTLCSASLRPNVVILRAPFLEVEIKVCFIAPVHLEVDVCLSLRTDPTRLLGASEKNIYVLCFLLPDCKCLWRPGFGPWMGWAGDNTEEMGCKTSHGNPPGFGKIISLLSSCAVDLWAVTFVIFMISVRHFKGMRDA